MSRALLEQRVDATLETAAAHLAACDACLRRRHCTKMDAIEARGRRAIDALLDAEASAAHDQVVSGDAIEGRRA